GIVSAAGVQRSVTKSTPDNHFAVSPHGRVIVSLSGRINGTGSCPTVGAGIVSPASIEMVVEIASAPDNHFTASPYCRVIVSASGCVGRAGSRPAIDSSALRLRAVSPAGVEIHAAIISAPDDHFTVSPHRRVPLSGRGCVGRG